MKKCLLRYCQQSEIITVVKIKEKLFNIFITILYAPTRESTEVEFEHFYSTLDIDKIQCKSQEFEIVTGDLNAKADNTRYGDIVGKFRLGSRNLREE